ncbi:MAG: hypothetical protein R3C03_11840 [Pirellulaceae bacterium]
MLHVPVSGNGFNGTGCVASNNSIWNDHQVPKQIKRSRVIYSWLTNSLAILIILVCCVALWTREFRTWGEIRVAAAVNETNCETTRSILTGALKKATSNDALCETIRIASGFERGSPDAENLKTLNYEILRERLRFAIQCEPHVPECLVQLELTGSGTIQERKVVQNLMEHVQEIVDFELRDHAEVASQLLKANRESQSSLSSAMSRVDDVRSMLNQIFDALEQHQIAMMSTPGREEQLVTELVWLDRELKSEFGTDSPEYAEFSIKFENMMPAAPAMEANSSSPFQLSSTNIGNVPAKLTSLGELRGRIEQMPLDEIRKKIAEADRSLATPMIQDEAIAMLSIGETAPRMRVTEVKAAKHEPIGALSQRGVLLSILLAAFVVGWALSLNLNPTTFDEGFDQSHDLEKELQIPVVAKLTKSGEANQTKQSASTRQRIVGFSELVLFGTLLLFIGLFAINSEMREAIMTNPLHALSRVIWSIVH